MSANDYCIGRSAYRSGEPQSANPHNALNNYEAFRDWLRGWEDGWHSDPANHPTVEEERP